MLTFALVAIFGLSGSLLSCMKKENSSATDSRPSQAFQSGANDRREETFLETMTGRIQSANRGELQAPAALARLEFGSQDYDPNQFSSAEKIEIENGGPGAKIYLYKTPSESFDPRISLTRAAKSPQPRTRGLADTEIDMTDYALSIPLSASRPTLAPRVTADRGKWSVSTLVQRARMSFTFGAKAKYTYFVGDTKRVRQLLSGKELPSLDEPSFRPGRLIQTTDFNLDQDEVTAAFAKDPGKKIMIIGEGHGSSETLAMRREVARVTGDGIGSFSEGKTGDSRLAGIRGIETRDAQFEIAILLRMYLRMSEVAPDEARPIDLYTSLRGYGATAQEIQMVDQLFLDPALTTKMKKRAITFFQNHRRDYLFAKELIDSATTLPTSTDRVRVGFFGASHLYPEFDVTGEDERTIAARVPEMVLMMGGERHRTHILMKNGVKIYFYPKVLMASGPIEPQHIGQFIASLGATSPL